nr:heavy metal-associated domain-containing protein [Micromonospora sp. DSM 115978]
MSSHEDADQVATVVLEMSGPRWATEKARVEAVLGRRPGVIEVAANPVAQTALVRFDPKQTSAAQLAGWIRDCGYHCEGRSVPAHVCDPLTEPHRPFADVPHPGHRPAAHEAHAEHAAPAAGDGDEPPVGRPRAVPPHDAMGHGAIGH